MERRIKVTAAGAPRISVRAYLEYEDWDFERSSEPLSLSPGQEIVFDDDVVQTAGRIVVVPVEPGFWAAGALSFGEMHTIDCPAIEAEGMSWWHQLLGEEITNPDRGRDIRIGVVDAGFVPDDALAHVTFLEAYEEASYSPSEFWVHGEAVCRILSDRRAPECCAPIAPASELIFADATFTRVTSEDDDFIFPLGDADPSEHLDPRRVSDAIFRLAFEHEVDLINLSLGSFDEAAADPTNGVAQAIRAATEAGVTVVCAAGNEFTSGAAFPASLPNCIGVGAFGALGWGPPGSAVRELNEVSEDSEGELGGLAIFHWPESAFGRGVDTIGPGVGILVARDGQPAYDLSGTSFAAPIVTGMLAVELSRDQDYLRMVRDEERDRYARSRLTALCHRTGMDAELEGEGAFACELESN